MPTKVLYLQVDFQLKKMQTGAIAFNISTVVKLREFSLSPLMRLMIKDH